MTPPSPTPGRSSGTGAASGGPRVIRESRASVQSGPMKRLLLGALLLAPFSAARAGPCREVRPFVTAAGEAPLVVQATVVRHAQTLLPPSFIEVRVRDVLKGQAPARTLRILDPGGDLPTPSASALPVGTTWVLALHPRPGAGTYAFPACATTTLAVLGQNVFGNVSGGWDTVIPTQELRHLLGR